MYISCFDCTSIVLFTFSITCIVYLLSILSYLCCIFLCTFVALVVSFIVYFLVYLYIYCSIYTCIVSLSTHLLSNYVYFLSLCLYISCLSYTFTITLFAHLSSRSLSVCCNIMCTFVFNCLYIWVYCAIIVYSLCVCRLLSYKFFCIVTVGVFYFSVT